MTRRVLLLSTLLIITGIGILSQRIAVLGTPLFPTDNRTTWEVEVRTSLHSTQGRIKYSLAIPPTALKAKVVKESISSEGLAAAVLKGKRSRTLIWTGKASDTTPLSTNYLVQIEKGLEQIRLPKKTGDVDLEVLFTEQEIQEAKTFIRSTKRSKSDEAKANAVYDCAYRGICPGGDFFERIRNSERLIARGAALVLCKLGIKSHVARGFLATPRKTKADFIFWVRARVDGKIADFFPEKEPKLDSSKMIFWSYLSLAKKASKKRLVGESLYFISPIESGSGSHIQAGQQFDSQFWRLLSLQSLPTSVQATYQIMLLIPIGALIITFLRSIVGLRTFGTFMPILIALAFRETGLLWGVVLLCSIVFFGLTIRSFLRHLNLLLVPRLSATLSVVILIALIISRVSYEVGFVGGLSVTLFPIVIITMIVERMSISWEEVGAGKTLAYFTNSLLAALVSFAVMMEPTVAYWVFAFPEIILFALALTLLCGRYTGYRLSELYRFRALAKGAA